MKLALLALCASAAFAAKCSSTTCEFKPIVINHAKSADVVEPAEWQDTPEPMTHNIMIITHGNDENKCHKHTNKQRADGSWTPKYEGPDKDGHQFKGMHCGKCTDTEQYTCESKCECHQAGKHPSHPALPYNNNINKNELHGIELPDKLPEHPQHESNIVAHLSGVDVRHDTHTEHGGPGLPAYSEWSPWTTCSKKCDGGTQMRTRTCNYAESTCVNAGLGHSTDWRTCNTQPMRQVYGTCDETAKQTHPTRGGNMWSAGCTNGANHMLCNCWEWTGEGGDAEGGRSFHPNVARIQHSVC